MILLNYKYKVLFELCKVVTVLKWVNDMYTYLPSIIMENARRIILQSGYIIEQCNYR